MHWRVQPLGCVVALAVFAVVGIAVVVLVLRGASIGNGSGPLRADGFRAGSGLEDVPDRRLRSGVERVQTWRVTGNRDASFTVRLRNAGEAPVRVTGVRRDADGDDQQFAPRAIDAPVTLQPGEDRSVVVTGRSTACGSDYGGQITDKNGQTFVYDDGETQNVDFEAIVEFVCR